MPATSLVSTLGGVDGQHASLPAGVDSRGITTSTVRSRGMALQTHYYVQKSRSRSLRRQESDLVQDFILSIRICCLYVFQKLYCLLSVSVVAQHVKFTASTSDLASVRLVTALVPIAADDRLGVKRQSSSFNKQSGCGTILAISCVICCCNKETKC